MSRKIMFRAKDKFGKNWVYGYLTIMWGLMHIQDFNDENTAYEIAPDTLGECTNIDDKNSNDIYEGHIVRLPGNRSFVVLRANHISAFVLVPVGESSISNSILLKVDSHNYEIIGNIHDNPELLEK